jgi:hypothetical protein
MPHERLHQVAFFIEASHRGESAVDSSLAVVRADQPLIAAQGGCCEQARGLFNIATSEEQ